MFSFLRRRKAIPKMSPLLLGNEEITQILPALPLPISHLLIQLVPIRLGVHPWFTFRHGARPQRVSKTEIHVYQLIDGKRTTAQIASLLKHPEGRIQEVMFCLLERKLCALKTQEQRKKR